MEGHESQGGRVSQGTRRLHRPSPYLVRPFLKVHIDHSFLFLLLARFGPFFFFPQARLAPPEQPTPRAGLYQRPPPCVFLHHRDQSLRAPPLSLEYLARSSLPSPLAASWKTGGPRHGSWTARGGRRACLPPLHAHGPRKIGSFLSRRWRGTPGVGRGRLLVGRGPGRRGFGRGGEDRREDRRPPRGLRARNL